MVFCCVVSRVRPALLVLVWLFSAHVVHSRAQEPLAVVDTQQDAPPFTTPAQALAALRLPPGFQATLFAHEPQVRQPIAMTTDARGRLWVAENYTYAERPLVLDERHRDRIVVLEDRDGDGRAERSAVYWDQARQLTSIEVGAGGLWAMAPPHLLFLPDRDGDDRCDGPPVVVLDGFDVGPANRHNFANGLKWGPDGWLYGRNGISNVGRVAAPGTRREDRVEIGPGVWRYHPHSKRVEMVATGTTNPWGHDWDEHGELFFINTVIGHLWHAVPGAHFKRMFGGDSNPHVYELIDQTADHVHWDAAEAWTDVRKGVSQTTDAAGGGHAHCGMMIYLGDNWPAAYRGRVLALNMHGRRVNCDRLERSGASYVGRHEADLIFSDDPWFRGTELLSGPDGGVYIADWSDVGECHEADGVHRSSGRIFKITFGTPRSVEGLGAANRSLDLAALDSRELVGLQTHANEWFVRQACRLLQERAAAGQDLHAAQEQLRRLLAESGSETHRLRALWALYVTGGATESWLRERLTDPGEHVRAWAVRLLVDQGPPSAEARAALVRQAATDRSGLVLLYLASALQKLPASERWDLAGALAAREEFQADRVLPLLVWYGIEPAVPQAPERAAVLLDSSRMPIVRRYVARRLTGLIEAQPEAAGQAVAALARAGSSAAQREILQGMSEALQGWQRAQPPAGWSAAYDALRASSDPQVAQLARELAVVFSDGRALDELKQIAAAASQDLSARAAAIRALAQARADGLRPLLSKLLADRDLGAEAVRGLALLDDGTVPALLLDNYAKLNLPAREAALIALAARPASTRMLLAAIGEGRIEREQVPVFLVRQMYAHEDEGVHAALQKLWPELRPIAEDKQQRIARWKQELTPAALASADRSAGRSVWERSCAKCHLLFGEGGRIGPDLTGAQRSNLDYLLENIVDPSAALVANYRMTILELADGRVLSGVVTSRSESAWEVQTPTEKVIVRTAEIARSRKSTASLMPEGLLDVLQPHEVRDLVAYLMAPSQVALPAGDQPRAAPQGGANAGK
jgi:putative membrane-bound dehydrogenase-like protein